MYEAIIISDLHLGTKHSKADEVLQFLKTHQTKRLILNGDIIDGWALTRGSKWKNKHTKVILELLKISKHTEIIYVRGNHDDFVKNYVGLNFSGISFVDEYKFEHNSIKYLILHGDIFDVFIKKYKWLSKLGSLLYDIALEVNHLYNRYRQYHKLPYNSISQKMKSGVKKATNFINDFENVVVDYAKLHKYDAVIAGHIHTPADKLIKGVRYVNCGDWVESMTAVLIKENGNIELLKNF
jgi:UDP-2,3-diacylglucosamine pyrophosphatase LpxH